MLSAVHVRSTSGFYGAERVLETLLPNLQSRGVRTQLVVLSQTRNSRLSERVAACGLPVREIGPWAGGRLAQLRELRSTLLGFDIVHTHDYLSTVYARFVASQGCRLVATVHGWTNRSLKLRLYAKLEALAFRRFDAVVVVDASAASRLSSGIGSCALVRHVPNAVDLIRFQPPADAGSNSNCRSGVVFGCIGRLSAEKGQLDLVQAFADGKLAERGARLLFIGDGPDREALSAAVSRLGLQHCVDLAGVRADMELAYREIDCLVLPSHTEGMPMVVLEAMACAKPVLSTAVGAVPELLGEQRGLLVPVRDVTALAAGLNRMIDMRPGHQAMGVLARRFIEQNYSPEIQAARYVDLYNKVLLGSAR